MQKSAKKQPAVKKNVSALENRILFTRKDALILVGIFILAFVMRFIMLDFPAEPYFDEVYYQPAANNYLDGKLDTNWVHPPFAKILMAAGVRLTSDAKVRLDYTIDKKTKNSIEKKPDKNYMMSYRVASCFFGALMPVLAYLFGLYFFRKRFGALAAAFLVNFDFLLFVLSRISLLDIFLAFFMLAASLCLWLGIYGEKPDTRYLLASAALTGLAISCKWNGVFLIPLVFIALLLYHRRFFLRIFPLYCVISVIFYLLTFVFYFTNGGTPSAFIGIINSTMKFQYSGWTHTYMAPLWKFPLMMRGIWFYYIKAGEGGRGIIAMGNPFVWWSFLLFFIWVIYRYLKNLSKNDLFILLGYISTFIFWVFSNRGGFFYYMAPAVIWMSLIITSVFMQIREEKQRYIYTGAYLTVVLAMFILYYPVLVGLYVSTAQFRSLIFLKLWI